MKLNQICDNIITLKDPSGRTYIIHAQLQQGLAECVDGDALARHYRLQYVGR